MQLIQQLFNAMATMPSEWAWLAVGIAGGFIIGCFYGAANVAEIPADADERFFHSDTLDRQGDY